jgi:hypothetical protein
VRALALALVDVAEVHADRLDGDQQLARAGRRIGAVLEVENLGPSVVGDDDGSHSGLLPG